MKHARYILLAAALPASCLSACRPVGAAEGFVPYAEERAAMVREQIAARGVKDKRVLAAMREVQRHEFVPEEYRGDAHGDHPLPIGHRQTISQPYIVAYMTEALGLKKGDKVLEIGTGSGYQAAVLTKLTPKVFSIEIICPLEKTARAVLDRLGFKTVRTRCADGYKGWPEEAPFDAIMLTAAPPEIPRPLLDQLAEGGRLVAPVGGRSQDLVRIRRIKGKLKEEKLLPVRFVPMTGEAQKKKAPPGEVSPARTP
ncbi:MAG: protein-L-isoaspartate(D-aspartate) O-methyltransferase [Elusimicrobia bacterium]|nr:MAG: protein-L-isoaspartate(D-aspartate) O-methyltransferase [Elusimicrobiota bacterium]